MNRTWSESFLWRSFRNRAMLSLYSILTVVFLATGFPIAALSYEGQCVGLFEDSFTRRNELIQQYKQGAQNFTGVRSFALKAAALSDGEKQALMQDLGAVYRLVPKKDPNPTAAWHIGGRRLLDYAQTLIARTDLLFKSEINRGATPTQAYAKFLQQQQDLFTSNYGANEVLVIIRTLQKNLQSLQPAGSQGAPYKLLLAGSFINGKANLQKSDIDLTISASSLMSQMPLWQKQINEALKDSLGEVPVQMSLEAHSEPAGFYGRINPIVIEITRDAVQIFVFEPATVRQKADELAAGAMATYLLMPVQ